MGTPDYAAPEVYDGKADERSDIYALGITPHETLTGAPPKGYFQLPSALAPVDHRVDQVVVKALEIDPAARYQKASDMQLAVEAATRAAAERSQIKLRRRCLLASGDVCSLRSAACPSAAAFTSSGWSWQAGGCGIDDHRCRSRV